MQQHGAGQQGGAVLAMDGQQQQQEEEEGDEVELPDSIKLGLGDFIFYSMLVGRAAMYDMMTGGWRLLGQACCLSSSCAAPSYVCMCRLCGV